MSLIIVDENKCNRDGICVRECPIVLLAQEDEKSIPKATDNAEKMCLHCGHCVAVCPSGALSLSDIQVDDCLPIKKELIIDVEKAEQFFRSRRSIRNFKDNVASKETIEKLIDLARYAPTAHNDQAVEWVVISGKDEVKKHTELVIDYMRQSIKDDPEMGKKKHYDLLVGAWDMGFDAISRNAPHLIITHASKTAVFSKYYPVDCATALGYMELAAPSLGLGTCWNGMFLTALNEWEPLQNALSIPKLNGCYGVLMAGYPGVKYYRMPTRKEPKIMWK
jgi:nitroreductase/NAD-dependent dihydropyrimidine dehydrogenase PreA subunit